MFWSVLLAIVVPTVGVLGADVCNVWGAKYCWDTMDDTVAQAIRGGTFRPSTFCEASARALQCVKPLMGNCKLEYGAKEAGANTRRSLRNCPKSAAVIDPCKLDFIHACLRVFGVEIPSKTQQIVAVTTKNWTDTLEKVCDAVRKLDVCLKPLYQNCSQLSVYRKALMAEAYPTFPPCDTPDDDIPLMTCNADGMAYCLNVLQHSRADNSTNACIDSAMYLHCTGQEMRNCSVRPDVLLPGVLVRDSRKAQACPPLSALKNTSCDYIDLMTCFRRFDTEFPPLAQQIQTVSAANEAIETAMKNSVCKAVSRFDECLKLLPSGCRYLKVYRRALLLQKNPLFPPCNDPNEAHPGSVTCNRFGVLYCRGVMGQTEGSTRHTYCTPSAVYTDCVSPLNDGCSHDPQMLLVTLTVKIKRQKLGCNDAKITPHACQRTRLMSCLNTFSSQLPSKSDQQRAKRIGYTHDIKLQVCEAVSHVDSCIEPLYARCVYLDAYRRMFMQLGYHDYPTCDKPGPNRGRSLVCNSWGMKYCARMFPETTNTSCNVTWIALGCFRTIKRNCKSEVKILQRLHATETAWVAHNCTRPLVDGRCRHDVVVTCLQTFSEEARWTERYVKQENQEDTNCDFVKKANECTAEVAPECPYLAGLYPTCMAGHGPSPLGVLLFAVGVVVTLPALSVDLYN